MKKNISYKLLFLSLLIIGFSSCNIKQKESEKNKISKVENEKAFTSLILKHLNAVQNKDLNTLKSTMSPKGNMELIQPSSEIVYAVDGFMKFHQEWFKVPNWTINTKILSTDIGDKFGVATTEFLYKEPERNGKPYFNRLIVTYALEKIDNNWYIIKDHASSIEKTID
ncbi:nuclear transport factor 2 family protein [Aureibaculum luteum]|uniref:nuclear transport factor 2 family protein n=1 Tax=Aureibaculum luteum TaxID=1548456 RepID=UPI000E52AADF|nr:nuclear transport factor 2 family protein [Aureibaculum luteum]